MIPMHYRTPAVDFLEPPDRFLALFDDVDHVQGQEWSLPGERPSGPRVVVLQPPVG